MVKSMKFLRKMGEKIREEKKKKIEEMMLLKEHRMERQKKRELKKAASKETNITSLNKHRQMFKKRSSSYVLPKGAGKLK